MTALGRAVSTLCVNRPLAVAVIVCAAILSGPVLAPAFGRPTTHAVATSDWASRVGGPCTAGARYTLRVERVQNQLTLELVVRARAGSRWDYSMVMRNGEASTEDSARMTTRP